MIKNSFKYLKKFNSIDSNWIYLLESVLTYKKEFLDLLKEIDDPIARDLENLYNKDIDNKNNLINITNDKNDTLTSIPDKKYQHLLNTNAYSINNPEKLLSRKIDKFPEVKRIWDYFKMVPPEEKPKIHSGMIGFVELKNNKENTITSKSDRTYVVFNPMDRSIKPFIININALIRLSNYKNDEIIKNTQEVKVGRAVKSILIGAKIERTDKEIEDFVNKYKAAFDISKDIFRFFQIVEGEEIRKWYNVKNYETKNGTLGGSCMQDESKQSYLNMYVQNPEKIKLVILKSKEDKSKIKGRALLWYLDDGKIFMDRIYTNNDNDVNLFSDFAKKNGWWRKYTQQQGYRAYVDPKGVMIDKDMELVVSLNKMNFTKFPYLDTMRYYLYRKYQLSSVNSYMQNEPCIILTGTTGGFSWADYRKCPTCAGKFRMTCKTCNGNGQLNCKTCRGTAHLRCECSTTIPDLIKSGLKIGDKIYTNGSESSARSPGGELFGPVTDITNTNVYIRRSDNGDSHRISKDNNVAWAFLMNSTPNLSEYSYTFDRSKEIYEVKDAYNKDLLQVGKLVLLEDSEDIILGVICKIPEKINDPPFIYIAQNRSQGKDTIEKKLYGFKYSWGVSISSDLNIQIIKDIGPPILKDCKICKNSRSKICHECHGNGIERCPLCNGKGITSCPECRKYGLILNKA